jgi:hypothetical protein
MEAVATTKHLAYVRIESFEAYGAVVILCIYGNHTAEEGFEWRSESG